MKFTIWTIFKSKKVGYFGLVSYLFMIPLSLFMLSFLDISWNNAIFCFTLLAFLPLLALFVLVCFLWKNFFIRLFFAIVWVFFSSVFLQSIALFLSVKRYGGDFAAGMAVFLTGDITLFLPLWIILGLVATILAKFLLPNRFTVIASKTSAHRF